MEVDGGILNLFCLALGWSSHILMIRRSSIRKWGMFQGGAFHVGYII